MFQDTLGKNASTITLNNHEHKKPKHHSVERDILIKYLRGALKNEDHNKLKNIKLPFGNESPTSSIIRENDCDTSRKNNPRHNNMKS